MRVIIILFFFFIWGINSAFAYDLVLPKEKKTVTKTNYAFFVGRAEKNETIIINDEKVFTASNGAFAHSVKLKEGENRIVLKSNYNTNVYRFIKEVPINDVKEKLLEFEAKLFVVKKDNTPLRKTPIDYGMNRLSHLFEGTYLLVDAEQGDFYRVVLSKDEYAWVGKSYVKASDDIVIPAFLSVDNRRYKNASKHVFNFSENLPYTVEETSEEVVFRVYNPIVSEKSVYTFNIKKTKRYSYRITLNQGCYEFKLMELPMSKTETSLEDIIIALDAGHGGQEKGAIGCLGDKEKDINLSIALELEKILISYGAEVIMTRDTDVAVSLDERVRKAQENCADIFISIHLNSIPDIKMDVHKNKGTSVYYYNTNSKELAEIIQESVTQGLETRKDGVKTASFAVIRPTDYIGVLVEVAYMTNPIDSVLYTKEDFAKKTAKAIAEGILEYVNSQ